MNDTTSFKHSAAEVLDKMVAAGWVKGYVQTEAGLGIEWTEKGKKQAKKLRALLEELRTDPSAEVPPLLSHELAALVLILYRFLLPD